MNKSSLYAVFLSTALSTFYASSACAAIVVYTDRVAWETAALSVGIFRITENFESVTPVGLSTGYNSIDIYGSGELVNDFGPGMNIMISADPGFNAIDDSATPDVFSNVLSPNGSTYYLGETGVSVPSLTFAPFAAPPSTVAFGAEWVWGLGGGEALVMEIGETTVSFSTYLPTGSGFLGVVNDQGKSIDGLALRSLSGVGPAFFGMDDVRYVVMPVPPAVWLFGSGLIGLIGIARRKKA